MGNRYAPVDIRAVLSMGPTNRSRALAILLSRYADRDGYFDAIPKNILRELLPGQDDLVAARYVQLLKNQDWLTNQQVRGSRSGTWQLNVKRPGKIPGIDQEVRAELIVEGLLKEYRLETLKRVAALLEE